MTPPDWLVPILQQFPIVALVGVAVWVAIRWSDRRTLFMLDRLRREQDETQAERNQRVEDARANADQAEQRYNAEIQRLETRYDADVKRLWARIRELEKHQRSPGSDKGGTA